MPESTHARLKSHADKMGLKGEERRKYIYGNMKKEDKKKRRKEEKKKDSWASRAYEKRHK